ncbi:hypothetical protein LCGC14_0232490 [marine sediment metagenome]|uniref:Uncharacterized protein n=1 Tax=marine sediment metagenome TaxID=412755 RepID=A0A0F9XED6_9ZZZZ
MPSENVSMLDFYQKMGVGEYMVLVPKKEWKTVPAMETNRAIIRKKIDELPSHYKIIASFYELKDAQQFKRMYNAF